MKYLLILPACAALACSASPAMFTNSVTADAFVRAANPTLNYGLAGALSVSGANAANGTGFTNGLFDSFIRFNTGAMVTNFNALFGSNNWAIDGAKLLVTETGAPANTNFNRGVGGFQIKWIANDNWAEGTGNPNAPTTTGIVYNQEASLLNDATDKALGTFTNSGANASLSFTLGLPASFTASMADGGDVVLYLTAADAGVGFTFDSKDFGTTSAHPFIVVSAILRPAITSISYSATNIVITATNGVAGGTYYLLGSGGIATPLNQWLPVATNVLNSNGGFSMTITNANFNAVPQQFFILQTQ